jgi:prolyl-tRNA synthetase
MAMLWGKMQAELDRMFKETGHQNAYFHYLFQRVCLKQKRKCRGFAKECAIVTHYKKTIQING